MVDGRSLPAAVKHARPTLPLPARLPQRRPPTSLLDELACLYAALASVCHRYQIPCQAAAGSGR
jgi:hypothetical protein